jgi:TolB protein
MKLTRILTIALAAAAAALMGGIYAARPQTIQPHPKEVHLRNIRQLTFGGENAEAYFSFDGQRIIFQSTRDPYKCDQIFTMNRDGSNQKLISTGKGRTTCGYFTPDGKRVIYASTHLGGPDCPPPADRSEGYVWAIYRAYDIFSAKVDGTDLKRLTTTDGYDAEGTISTDGKKIVFTSARDIRHEHRRHRPTSFDQRTRLRWWRVALTRRPIYRVACKPAENA